MFTLACTGVIACFGALAGVVFLLFWGIEKLTKNNFIVVFIADIASVLLAGFLFILSIFKAASGDFAFFEVICFLIGFIFVLFVKNSVASFVLMLYNKFKLRRKGIDDKGKTN